MIQIDLDSMRGTWYVDLGHTMGVVSLFWAVHLSLGSSVSLQVFWRWRVMISDTVTTDAVGSWSLGTVISDSLLGFVEFQLQSLVNILSTIMLVLAVNNLSISHSARW